MKFNSYPQSYPLLPFFAFKMGAACSSLSIVGGKKSGIAVVCPRIHFVAYLLPVLMKLRQGFTAHPWLVECLKRVELRCRDD